MMETPQERMKAQKVENEILDNKYQEEQKKKLNEQEKAELKELWRKYEKARKEFEKEFNIFSGQVTTFQEQLQYLITVKNDLDGTDWTKTSLAREAGISPKTIVRYTSGHFAPSMSTLMSICIILQLDIPQATALLTSLGFCFLGTRREHYAYMYLLQNCKGKSIDECNEILTGLHIDPKYHLTSKKLK